jgi:predicted nucleic acid-binding protein
VRLMLDTSAYAAFMRGHPGVQTFVQQASCIVLSSVVLGELQAGFLGGTRRLKNEKELRTFLSSPRVSVAEVDHERALRYAEILFSLRCAGTPIPTNDVWIAAGAMQHGLRVLTTDSHYRRVSQVVVELCAPNPALP